MVDRARSRAEALKRDGKLRWTSADPDYLRLSSQSTLEPSVALAALARLWGAR